MKGALLFPAVILWAALGCRTAQVNNIPPGPKEYVATQADYREFEAVVKNCMRFGFSRSQCERDTMTDVCHPSWPKGYCGQHLRLTRYLEKYMD